MDLKSLGYKTELIFPVYDGEIIDRGDYLVIRTPSIPDFFWGNYLLFKDPPRPGDIHLWRERFKEEIGKPPHVHHEVFGWDTTAGEIGAAEDFTSAGFTLMESAVLVAQDVHPPARPNEQVQVRPMVRDEEWQQALENQIDFREPGFAKGPFRDFKTRQFDRYRRMSADGLGDWFGAFLGDRLVADLGIFHNHEIARFQNVETDPEFRRQGIASALVYQATRYAQEHYGVDTLVIIADRDSAPARMYAGIGYQIAEFQAGLERRDMD